MIPHPEARGRAGAAPASRTSDTDAPQVPTGKERSKETYYTKCGCILSAQSWNAFVPLFLRPTEFARYENFSKFSTDPHSRRNRQRICELFAITTGEKRLAGTRRVHESRAAYQRECSVEKSH